MSDNWLDQIPNFDIITSGLAIFQDMMNGPATHLGVPGLQSTTDLRKPVKQTLKRYNIQCWGFMHLPGFEYLSFSVRQTDAQRAVDVLERNKIPVLSAPPWVQRGDKPSDDSFLSRLGGAIGWDTFFK